MLTYCYMYPQQRKLKTAHKEAVTEKHVEDKPKPPEPASVSHEEEPETETTIAIVEDMKEPDSSGGKAAALPEVSENQPENPPIPEDEPDATAQAKPLERKSVKKQKVGDYLTASETDILLLQFKNTELLRLKDTLRKEIEAERNETAWLKSQLHNEDVPISIACRNSVNSLDEVMDLLHKENQILEIEKINLVRQIMEQQEMCIELRAKLAVCGLNQNLL